MLFISLNVLFFQRYSINGPRGAIHCPKIDVDKTGSVYLPENIGKTVVIKGVNFPFLNVRKLVKEFARINCQLSI